MWEDGDISIHALREEGDFADGRLFALIGISIHALREEGDFSVFDSHVETIKFLSTPSARRATLHAVDKLRLLVISIHALREEGDPSCPTTCH